MHLQRIKGNIKGGLPNFIELSPKTVVWGENGSGKSTITNAIELVCGGFASDVMGREVVRKPSDLIVLKGLGLPKQTLKIQGELSNGTQLSYELRETEKGAGKPRHIGPKGLVIRFPFQEVKENLIGSADKARSWLSSNLPINKYLQVTPSLRKQMLIHQESSPQSSLSEILETIQELYKRKVRDARTEIKACEMTKDMLGKDFAPLEEYIVKQAEERANTFLNEIMSMGKAIKKEDVEQAMNSLQQLQSKCLQLKSQLDNLPNAQSLSDTEKQEIETLNHLYHVLVLNEQYPNCYVCNAPKTEKRITPQNVRDVLSNVEQRMQITKQRESLNIELAKYVEQFNSQQERYNSLANAFHVQSQSNINIHHEYNLAVKEHESLKTKYRNFQQVQELNAKMLQLEKDIEEYNKIIDEAQSSLQEAIQQAIETFCDSVTKYLPKPYEFIMELTSSQCRIGILKYGTKCFAVSGAEWVAMVLAIASVTSETSQHLNIFIPEERAFDQNSFCSLMEALKDVNGQVILTSTQSPPKMDGWTNVECSYIPF